jgi:hypothetical protein
VPGFGMERYPVVRKIVTALGSSDPFTACGWFTANRSFGGKTISNCIYDIISELIILSGPFPDFLHRHLSVEISGEEETNPAFPSPYINIISLFISS